MNNKNDINYSLPTTRKEELKYIIRFRYKALFLLGGILIIFSLPLLASLFIKDLKAISIITTSTNDSDLSKLLINDLFYAVFIIPSFVIFFIGLSGIYYIIRKFIWAEGVLFKYDFFIGIRQNWKHFSFNGLLFSILFYGSYLSTIYIDIDFLKYLPLAICFVFIYPVILIHLNLTTIYKNTYFAQFRNALIIYINKFLVYLAFFIVLIFIPFLMMIFPLPLAPKYIILFLYIYLFIPVFILVISVYSIYVFDEYINKEKHKELYKKGLF